MTNRLEGHPHYADAVAWLSNYHGSIDSTALVIAYLAGRDAESEGHVREDEAHEIGYSKGHVDGYYEGVHETLASKRGGNMQVQWGVYYEDYPQEEDNYTYRALDERQARALTAQSPTDRGLRRRYVSEWEQVD